MYKISDKHGQIKYAASLKEAAKITQLEPNEVAWAIEEYGECETDEHTIVPHAKSASNSSHTLALAS